MYDRSSHHRAAFTLIEIMVVVIVIGVIAALIVPNLFDRAGKAKSSVAKQQIGAMETAINLFQQDYGRFPESLQELVNPPADVEGASPPTIKPKDLIDPWGNPYVYRYPGDRWPFEIISLGADGADGGEGENADLNSYE